MKRASILWILVVVGYLGFEVDAIRRSRHLFEPLHTLDVFTSAQRASQRCGDPEDPRREPFERNLASVRRRARDDLARSHPQQPSEAVERMLAERTRAREAEVDALVAAEGCESGSVWRLLKLHEQRARLTVR